MRAWKVTSSVAELHFAIEAPADWKPVDLPPEVPDFENPLAFAPVAMLAAPYAAVVFSIAARPAYAEGSLSDWLGYVTREQNLDPGPIESEQVGPHAAVGCWSGQMQDGVVMRSRLALFEDGTRIVTLTCLAPDALWASVAVAFRAMLDSFRLTVARGANTARSQGDELPPSSFVPKATSPEPTQPQPQPQQTEAKTTMPASQRLARAAGMGSFDQDDPINARLRDRGVGLVPNLLDYDEQERWATLAPGSLRATLRVPFGWHVVDDGKRTLVFDAGGTTQVNLHLVPRRDRNDDTILMQKLVALREERPTLEWVRFDAEGWECLAIRNLEINGEQVEQCYLLRGMPDDLVLEMRVTSSPDTMSSAVELGGFLMQYVEAITEPGPGWTIPARKEPAWWLRALQLEKEDELAEAERVIFEAIDHLGAYSQVAHLYELRAERLRASGDATGAEEAIRRGENAMTSMAAGATSCGEGAALSLQVDDYRKRHGLGS